MGNTIKPIDQKNSNTKAEMVFASPLVISAPWKKYISFLKSWRKSFLSILQKRKWNIVFDSLFSWLTNIRTSCIHQCARCSDKESHKTERLNTIKHCSCGAEYDLCCYAHNHHITWTYTANYKKKKKIFFLKISTLFQCVGQLNTIFI